MAGKSQVRLDAGEPAPALGRLQIAIIALAVATAAIHIYMAVVVMPSLDPVFLLNGLGYLGLTAALYLPLRALDRRRPLIRWVLIGYTALTILLWFLITQFGGTERTTLGSIDKLIELALIVLLFVEGQRTPRR